mgnify:CR=1 FL=1
MRRPESGLSGFAGGSDFAGRQRRGTGSRDASSSANRKREELLRIAVRQNSRGLLVYRRSNPQRNRGCNKRRMNQSGELIVGNCFLIIFQHAPPRMCAKNSEIVRSVSWPAERSTNEDCDNRERIFARLLELKHPRLDFASFNTMLAEC